MWHRRPAGVLLASVMAVAIVSLLAGGSARAQRAPSTAPAAAATVPIEHLIERLGHPCFEIRDQTTAALRSVDDQVLPRLVQAYRGEGRHEVRLRLRDAIEHLYFQQLMRGRTGFMGVGLPMAPSNIFDPQTGMSSEAIVLQRVLPGFPAEKAGVKTGDIIVEYEGRPVREVLTPRQTPRAGAEQALEAMQRGRMMTDPRLDAFTAEVAEREPGSTVRMRLLRCGDKVRTVPLTVAADRAKTLEGLNIAPTLIATAAGRAGNADAAGAYTAAGLAVAGVAAGTGAVDTGLAVGDVIVGLGGEPLRTGNSPTQLYEAVKALPPGSVLSLDVIRVMSVHVSITLGGRPVDLMNPDDMKFARMKFAAWWREQSGEQSIIRDPNRSTMSVPLNPTPASAVGPVILP